MKISIFKDAKAHPRSKAEKVSESFKVSNPHLPTTVTITTEDDLIKYVTEFAWSPIVFSSYRHADNFVSCDWLVYDIDEGLTIEGAADILDTTSFCWVILPSPSHTEEAHRFRIIIPLSHSILDFDTYDATWLEGAKLLGVVDQQCKDKARYYFGSRKKGGYSNFEGDFFVPVKKQIVPEKGYKPSHSLMLDVSADHKDLIQQIYGQERDRVSEAVDYFIRNAHTGIPGSWTNSLNAFSFSLSQSGVDGERIYEVVEKLAPYPLDERDKYQLNKAIKDGIKERLKI